MSSTSFEDYDQRGHSYRQAWEILARGCETPPSLDVFEHELKLKREGRDGNRARPHLSVTVLAHEIAANYHRVPGWEDGHDF